MACLTRNSAARFNFAIVLLIVNVIIQKSSAQQQEINAAYSSKKHSKTHSNFYQQQHPQALLQNYLKNVKSTFITTNEIAKPFWIRKTYQCYPPFRSYPHFSGTISNGCILQTARVKFVEKELQCCIVVKTRTFYAPNYFARFYYETRTVFENNEKKSPGPKEKCKGNFTVPNSDLIGKMGSKITNNFGQEKQAMGQKIGNVTTIRQEINPIVYTTEVEIEGTTTEATFSTTVGTTTVAPDEQETITVTAAITMKTNESENEIEQDQEQLASEVTVYAYNNFKEPSTILKIYPKCTTLSPDWQNRISSLNTNGNCIEICQYKSCVGRCLRVEPGSLGHNRLRDVNFDKRVTSMRVCSSNQQK